MADAYILDAVRTPRGRGKAGKGALSGIHPQELMAQVLNGLAERSGIDPAEVDDVVVGCVSQAGEQGANVARNAILAAGWPIEVTGVSLNRFCGSGLQAVSFAAMGVASGYQRLVVAGGVESMSRNPIGSDGAGQDGNNLHLRKRHHQVPQGISADLIATLEGFSREEIDAFALESQRRAAKAEQEGHFGDRSSRIPVRDPETGQVALAKDEHPRPETTAEGLAALAPSFVAMGETWDPIALQRYPEACSGKLHVTVKSADDRLVGRAFSSAVVELALANYPGFFVSSPPTEAQPFGVYWPALVANGEVHHEVVFADGRRLTIEAFDASGPVAVPQTPNGSGAELDPAELVGPEPGEPLGNWFGARSGDKGGNANVGVWARDAAGYAWLERYLTPDAIRQLIPEAALLPVHRYELPNLLAVNFVIVGYLGEGVASSTAFDPQAKGLGEYLRSRPAPAR